MFKSISLGKTVLARTQTNVGSGSGDPQLGDPRRCQSAFLSLARFEVKRRGVSAPPPPTIWVNYTIKHKNN